MYTVVSVCIRTTMVERKRSATLGRTPTVSFQADRPTGYAPVTYICQSKAGWPSFPSLPSTFASHSSSRLKLLLRHTTTTTYGERGQCSSLSSGGLSRLVGTSEPALASSLFYCIAPRPPIHILYEVLVRVLGKGKGGGTRAYTPLLSDARRSAEKAL